MIVGAGFGGLACARALAGTDLRVTVLDKRNYHLFQPLLYQVATAALSPADIAAPIRRVLAGQKNIEVLLAEVEGVDAARRIVMLKEGGALHYDQLVLATGSAYNYFAHPEWAQFAPAPKSLSEARAIRASLLRSFEIAERRAERGEEGALKPIVVVGGGPTGVELAGAIAELARCTLRGDFKHIDPTAARIILIEAGPRLLNAFPEELGAYALRALQRLGVEVRLNSPVERIDATSICVAGEELKPAAIFWGAGIRASEGASWLHTPSDALGRIPVSDTLGVPGSDDVFAIGDLALFLQDGSPLPALAQVAQQQGAHLGKALRRSNVPGPFRYKSRGETAVIGRNAAVYSYGRFRLKGFAAFVLWSIVHIYLLIGFERRVLVMVQWIWRYFTFEEGARLID